MKITPVEAITAALTGQKAGFTTAEIRECLPASVQGKVSGTLNRMVKSGALIKHAGESPHKSRYSLNPETAPVTPRAAAPKRKARAKVQPTPPAPARPASESERFLLTCDNVFVTHSSPAAIAALMRELRA